MKPYEQIPTTEERKKIFHHLKKCSSYTAWNRVLGYYKVWAEIFEKSVAEAADSATYDKPAQIDTKKLVFVLKGLSVAEKCVGDLHWGNKTVFRHNGWNCFSVAHRPISYWGTHAVKYADGDIAFDPLRVPYWDEITMARRKLGMAWSELEVILDTSDTHDTAPFTFGGSDREFYFGGKTYQNDLGETFPSYHFPSILPEVPDPDEVVLIGYGDYVPCSGIWEPVKADVPKRKLVSLFSKPEMPSGPFEVAGSMNYLHEHSTAPHIGEGREPIPTTWRLLWKDDRYTDGTIPEEENDYIFNEPRESTSTPTSSSSNASDTIIFARTGERVIKAGVWAVQEDLNARQVFSVGDLLPQHAEREVTWVWTAS
jgi:Immunity protein 71/Immunity protein 72